MPRVLGISPASRTVTGRPRRRSEGSGPGRRAGRPPRPIAVAIEIGGGHPVRDVGFDAQPQRGSLFEGPVAPVPERDVAARRARPRPALPLIARPPRFGPGPAGLVHEIPGVAIPDQQVLISVEIHVQKQRRPGPSRRRDPGEIGDLGEGAVASVLEEGIALPLGGVASSPPPSRRWCGSVPRSSGGGSRARACRPGRGRPCRPGRCRRNPPPCPSWPPGAPRWARSAGNGPARR